MCPHCRQNAPVIYRGLVAYCTGCGKPRPPLTGTSVTHAGKPSKVGGAIASTLGWVVLAVGTLVALGLYLLLNALFPGAAAASIAAIAVMLGTAMVGGSLVAGGKKLERSGADAEKGAREQAVFAIARHKDGVVTALDLAQALGCPIAEADSFLTDMAKAQPNTVSVDIDSNGGLIYRFGGDGAERVRIEAGDDILPMKGDKLVPLEELGDLDGELDGMHEGDSAFEQNREKGKAR